MEILQQILVLITFLIAVGYLFTKFIWMPPFMRKNEKVKACGVSGCGCD
ncbi:hypothetical protein [Salegentibacter chungangensis]|uniref:FeoB-associated Cys-rich membrane protein n=1 Tax=Salegentibacter chungangensis TaxID=1335724 RepID=A0ABW3NNP9_9FLAO